MDFSKIVNIIKDKRVWLIFGGVLAVAAAVLFFFNSPPEIREAPASAVKLKALEWDGEYILPGTSFELWMENPPPIEELYRESMIKTIPEIAFELTEIPGEAKATAPATGSRLGATEATYRLTPLQPLKPNSTQVFLIGQNYQFVFKVGSRLTVTSAYPANGGENVRPESGIEFTFSEEITVPAFEAAFSISPAVEGSFESGNGRFVFRPGPNLEYGTEYTVTLDPALTSVNGAMLAKPYVLKFTTITERERTFQNMFHFSGNGASVNSLSSEIPMFQLYMDSEIREPNQTVGVKLYRFGGWEGYAEAVSQTEASGFYSAPVKVDTSALAEYASFEATPFNARAESDAESGYDNGLRIVQFPEALPAGWYAAEFTLDVRGEPVTRQVLLQVTDLSVFYMAMDEELLAWVNDASTGQPVSGAELEITGAYSGKGTTGADGTVRIPNATARKGYSPNTSTYLTVKAGDRVFADATSYDSGYVESEGEEKARQYMTYLFTDRTIYHTTDTIQIWGMIRARDGGALPDDLQLKMGDIVSQKVTPLPNGTFRATVKFEKTAAVWGILALKSGDDLLCSRNVTIEDFVKPVYTASAEPLKPVTMIDSENDVLTVGMDVSTFDGTPASSFGVTARIWYGSAEIIGSGEHRTDRNGHADIQIRVTDSPDTWYPYGYSYGVSSNEAQDENFYLSGEVYGIHRDLMLKGKPDIKAGRVEVTTNRIDISRIKTVEQLWEDNALKGEALSIPVTAQIMRVWWVKNKIGEHYDFVNRETVETFRYVRNEETFDTRSFTTAGGSFVMEDIPQAANGSYYYIVLTAKDSKGRDVECTVWLGSALERYGEADGTHRYRLVKRADPEHALLSEADGNTLFDSRLNNFEDNEDVTFELTDNDMPIEGMKGRLLYAVVQDDFSNTALSDKSAVTLGFSEKLLPNYMLTGAYFDGKHVFALENTNMSFDPRQRELDIKLAPDKPSYAPGEEMKVNATVTNKVTGRPAANTEVVLSVADEAVFAVSEQFSDILNSLYADIYYPYVRKYTSYLTFDLGGADGGRGGGGGGDGMRKDFADTAFFAAATTDSDGRASFSYALPDNITSWRLTSIALSPGNHAGNTKINVAATKDFFILPVVSQELLEGDSFAVGAYGSGVAVGDEDAVKYSITVQGEGTNATLAPEGRLREYTSADFGPLKKGDYTVTIAATCGAYKDGVQLPFSVIGSGVEVSRVSTYRLSGGISPDPLRWPINVAFYGAGSKTWNAVFNSVHRWSYAGGRADMRLARLYVASEHKRQGAEWYDADALEADYSDLNSGWIISLFPWSRGDIELTVLAGLSGVTNAVTWGDNVHNGIGEYYDGTLAAYHLGKALSKEDPEPGLAAMLASGQSLSFAERAYLALALHLNGDTATAKSWYGANVKPNLGSLTGISGDTALYIKSEGDDLGPMGDATAAASLLATALKTEEAEGLVRWLAEKGSPYEPYILEQIYFLNSFGAANGPDASFSYVRDGKTVTVKLGARFESVSFNRAQLQSADFKVPSGDVYADVYYAGSPDSAMDTALRKIGFSKTVTPMGNGFAPGALVKVTLTPDLSAFDFDVGERLMVVDDYIPTGMRFERYERDALSGELGWGWYLDSRQRQRLQFTVYGIEENVRTPIVYYARCAVPGTYVVESAYITSAYGGTWGATERSAVRIG